MKISSTKAGPLRGRPPTPLSRLRSAHVVPDRRRSWGRWRGGTPIGCPSPADKFYADAGTDGQRFKIVRSPAQETFRTRKGAEFRESWRDDAPRVLL